ncbi:MAG: hypothetical protein JW751_00350 [Polyangiaceae bacterium]|nr:hypothetical protein [Polyangiaceae bacterium]
MREDDKLTRTSVTPHLDTVLSLEQNTVFCSTFQLAWNELMSARGGEIQLEGDPPLVPELNAGGPLKADIDELACVALAGQGESFLRALRRQLVDQFGERDDFMLPSRLSERELLVYAHLEKNLVFSRPLGSDKRAGLAFGRTRDRVQCFGLWRGLEEGLFKARAEQVCVHEYRSVGEFLIELRTKDPEDRLVVARLGAFVPNTSLGAAVRQVMQRLDRPRSVLQWLSSSTKLTREDVLKIPLVDLDILHVYRELTGRGVSGTDWQIEDARQSIRFHLDERGAELRSAAAILTKRSGRASGRAIICDGPFLVLLARAGRPLPYFAAWIADPELLMRVDQASG